MQAVNSITLNFQQPNFVTVYAVQNDRLSRRITATLLDGSAAWEPPAGTLMTIRYRKPDGTVGFYDTLENGADAYAFNGANTVDFVLAEQALTVPGQVPVELNFYNGDGQRLSTLMFILAVKPSVLSDGEIVSSNYLNVLTAALTHAAQIWQNIQAAYGAPRVAATAAAMTDHSLIYVYTGSEAGYTNGNWYYWDGAVWASGGVYNSTAFSTDTTLSIAGKAADAAKTGALAAPIFSTSTAYTAGQHVIYNGTLYAFTADHAAGAWTGTDAQAVTLGGEISALQTAVAAIPPVDETLSPTSTNPVQNKAIQARLRELYQGFYTMQENLDAAEVSRLLHAEEIEGTTQTVVFDAVGNVSQIVHRGANNVSIRTDVFTYGLNTITEVRTLSTGDRLTIETNTTTLATTVTFTPST